MITMQSAAVRRRVRATKNLSTRSLFVILPQKASLSLACAHVHGYRARHRRQSVRVNFALTCRAIKRLSTAMATLAGYDQFAALNVEGARSIRRITPQEIARSAIVAYEDLHRDGLRAWPPDAGSRHERALLRYRALLRALLSGPVVEDDPQKGGDFVARMSARTDRNGTFCQFKATGPKVKLTNGLLL